MIGSKLPAEEICHTGPGASSTASGQWLKRGSGVYLPPYFWTIVDAWVVDNVTLEILWHGRSKRDLGQLIEFRQRHTEPGVNLAGLEPQILPPNTVSIDGRDFKFNRTPTFDDPWAQ